ncbi:MAG: ABC transporter substrate-binding protein [Bdellovibrio sp. ArHS]|uniref:basic amino acid ABC transporter substrate-binding protein n=1 Tax=Bdellovibrio sp. ArHS TaxID=1569284 RepID=UPI00058321A6|nr:basic amino acid ABC transporter substrate-binding protein [Bdellovibrio sp. ArHS]KHD89886.1 MAG: ABC transporter substrate-binding protein [Bdellovibrio sp. ArHS]
MKNRWLLLATIPLLLISCTKKEDTSLRTQPIPSELVVGTDAAYAPFESENADKSVEGFDIDIIHAVADRAGFKIKIVNTPWEGLFSQLASGDRDILISAITINSERKKVMDFSEPYFEAVQLIALPVKSKVTKFVELKDLKVGVQTGTTGDEVISDLLGKTNPNIKRFEGTPLALQELVNGGVDAVVADNGVIDNFLANNAKTFKTVADPSFSKEHYGIAVKKGNSELLKKINDALQALKKDGTYQKIHSKYFGKK